jgi:carboxypeptidase Taq
MQMMTEQEILAYYKQNATLGSVMGLLSWDQEALMPAGGIALRQDQLALLATLSHERATAPHYVESILSSDSQNPHISRLKKDIAKARALSPQFVEKVSRATVECQEIWKQARAEKNFSKVAPHLETLIQLNKEKLEAWRQDSLLKNQYASLSDYEVLLGEYDPGLKSETVRSLLKELASGLQERLPQILERQKSKQSEREKALLLKAMPVEAQRKLLNKVIEDLGFDKKHGRIDESTHPFCGGSEDDVRMTTRYRADDFTDSLSGSIHECGHALYEQGIPRDIIRTPCGKTDSFAIHESQSRLYENMLGRSEPFCAYLSQNSNLPADGLYTLFNWVEPSYIRVDADEVTYNLHVVLRMELEEALVEGKLSVKDLPEAWRSRFKELMGLEIQDESQGCLQDVHWYFGAFGYFPSYSLGNLLSAELFSEFSQAHSYWQEKARKGDFKDLLVFLRQRVHAQSSFEDTPTRIQKMLGGRHFGSQAFLKYVDQKYLGL